MKQVLFRKGQVIVEELPAPIAGEHEVLVQVHYSCISAGTELAGLKSSRKPPSLYQKALKQPEKVKRALEMIRSEGIAKTVARVSQAQQAEAKMAAQDRLVGYSASGIVLEVGTAVRDIQVGDRVACGGAGIANHAEFIAVPRNLLVKVPTDVPLDAAATMTLGAIAMQGVRRASVDLGSCVAVVGLGILGQLTVQMLKAAGCRVVGVDVDAGRIERALSLGMDKGVNPAVEPPEAEVLRFSDGYGVDSVIITAASEGSEIINQAMKMCRRKGKVVIVGAVGLNLTRGDFYAKELDVLMSTSYGPGRYDDDYELKGRDYPYGYVRWTQNRNMESYLRLIGEKRINIAPLIERSCPIEEAPRAYQELATGERKPLIVLLEYDRQAAPGRQVSVSARRLSVDRLNVGIIGAGAFVRGTHVPNLLKLSDRFSIRAVADKLGTNAADIARRCGASYAVTDHRKVLDDDDVNLVIIGTRHNVHASLAIEAARAGKAILVEKPMALNPDELHELTEVLEQTRVPFMVGFNRRFSPHARRIKEVVAGRANPMVINYQMNAGFIPLNHWVHTEEGGGRNIGEACHIYDLFTFLTGSEVESVQACSISPATAQVGRTDNFATVIRFTDGSVCNLVYTALGHSDVSKERMDVYVDGKLLRMDDYHRLSMAGVSGGDLVCKSPDKGHQDELAAFAQSIREGDGYPIPLWQLIQATHMSFAVEANL